MYRFLHRRFHLRYHGVYRHAKKLFVFDLALLGLAIIMFGSSLFFFFWKPGIVEYVDLSISLGGKRIKSGEETRITVDYANRSKFKLQSTSLGLHLPDGFVIDRQKIAESTFDSNSIFTQLKEMPAGAKGSVEIYGWLWTEPGKEEKILARLSYQPENTSRKELKLSHYLVSQPESVLKGELSIASSTLANQTLNFTYAIANHSAKTVSNVSLAHNWPDKIIDDKYQKINLLPNEEKIVTGQITAPNKTGEFALRITPQISINNRLMPQKTSQQIFEVITPNVPSQANFPSKISYADQSRIIPIALSWQNQSQYRLTNLQMRLKSNYNIIDWQQTAVANNAKTDGNSLLIDYKTRTQLQNGNPDSSDSFTVNLHLNSALAISQTEKAYLEIMPIMEAFLESAPTQKFSQEGTIARIPIATQVSFTSEIRYYTDTGDQLGRGPLPPQVGKITKYWVSIHILNTSNPLKDAYFKTSLPFGIELTGKESVTIGSQIKYDKSSRTVTWNQDNLPANSQAGVYFEIQTTPTSEQIGKEIKLTNDSYFSATDEWVNKKFNLRSAGLNNKLQANDKGSQKDYLVAK